MPRHSAPGSSAQSRSRGRPREFDLDTALDQAIRVFSERGYHATSISDLTEATGLAQGSLYKAFQDKHGLFLAALARYRTLRDAQIGLAIGTPESGLEGLRRALRWYADASTAELGQQGCLVVGSMAKLSTFPADVAQDLQAALDHNEARFAALLRQAQSDGSVRADLDSQASARMLLCLTQGMRIVGKARPSRASMHAVVDAALCSLV